MPIEEDDELPEIDETEEGPPRDWMTRKEVAEYLERSESTVIRLERQGRLTSTTPPGKRQRFKRDEVMRLRSEMRAERSAVGAELVPTASDLAAVGQHDVAAAHVASTAVTDLTTSANTHAQEFGRQLLLAIRTSGENDRKHFTAIVDAYSRENRRLGERVEQLEIQLDRHREAIEEQRQKAEDARDREHRRAMLTDAWSEAKALAKAIMASKMRGEGKSSTQASAFDSFLQTLSPEQTMTIMSALTTEQLATLQALMASVVSTPSTEESTT